MKSSSYAKTLNSHISDTEPEKLKDQLLVCALIEARSCERFSALAPYMPIRSQNFIPNYMKLSLDMPLFTWRCIQNYFLNLGLKG